MLERTIPVNFNIWFYASERAADEKSWVNAIRMKRVCWSFNNLNKHIFVFGILLNVCVFKCIWQFSIQPLKRFIVYRLVVLVRQSGKHWETILGSRKSFALFILRQFLSLLYNYFVFCLLFYQNRNSCKQLAQKCPV